MAAEHKLEGSGVQAIGRGMQWGSHLVEAPPGELWIQSASRSKDAGYLTQTPAEAP